MGVLPNTRIERVEFCEEHLTQWAAEAVNIGTTAGAVTDLQAKTDAARAAYLEAKEARNVAKARTNAFNVAAAAMTAACADIIKQIKAKAAISGDAIYTLAQIPAPATPTPVGELTTPTNFKVTINAVGEVTISWKCTQPKSATGVAYQVWRRVGNVGPFSCLGGTGEKKWKDTTIPAGTSVLWYKIKATRSTSESDWGQFVVSLGSEGGEIMSVVETPASKIAA